MTANREKSQRSPGLSLVLVAFGLSCLASGYLVSSATVTSESGVSTVTDDDSGKERRTRESQPLVDADPGTVIFFSVPVVITAAPLFVRRRLSSIIVRTSASVLLFLWVLLLAFAGGIFYMPSLASMAAAAALAASQPKEPSVAT